MNSNMYHEIFAEFQKAATKDERISVLKKHGNQRFIIFMNYLFNPIVKFDVEIPKYRPAIEPAGLNYTYLDSEIPKLYRFIVGHPSRKPGLTSKKQQQLLLVVLESLHKEEADILVRLMQKDLKIKFLTPKLVKEAFPELPI